MTARKGDVDLSRGERDRNSPLTGTVSKDSFGDVVTGKSRDRRGAEGWDCEGVKEGRGRV